MELLQISHPSVLRNILENLDTPDLTTSRLVNSFWSFEACQILRERISITFTSWKELGNYCQVFEESIPSISLRLRSFQFECRFFSHAVQNHANGELDKLQEALQRFVESSGQNVFNMTATIIPILTFKDDSLMDPLHSTFMLEQLSKMIYEGYPNLRSLQLTLLIERTSLPENYDVESVLRCLPQKLLPNLENVSLKLHDLVPGVQERVISSFVKTLLLSSRNLQSTFTWSRWDTRDGYLLLKDRILANISSMSSTIRALEIMEMLSDQDLKTLMVRNFPSLEHVEISIDASSVNEDTLKLFLLRNRHSLRSLNLSFVAKYWKSVEFCSQLPPPGVIMKELEILCLKFYHGGGIALGNMPKLQKLDLYRCSNLIQILCPNDPPHKFIPPQRLQQLEVSGWSSLSEILPCRMPTWFSSLTSLNIGDVTLSPKSMSEIFKEAKGLRNLSIKFCREVHDTAICGMGTSLLKSLSPWDNLQKDMNAVEVTELISKANRDVTREKSYIGNLEELRFLTLKGDLSDLSVLYGIVNCSKLKRLRLASFTQNLTWRAGLIIKYGLKDLVEGVLMVEEDEAVLGLDGNHLDLLGIAIPPSGVP